MLSNSIILKCILLVPFLGACLMLFFPRKSGKIALLEISLYISTGVFILNIYL
jgi:hypothetical protein